MEDLPGYDDWKQSPPMPEEHMWICPICDDELRDLEDIAWSRNDGWICVPCYTKRGEIQHPNNWDEVCPPAEEEF